MRDIVQVVANRLEGKRTPDEWLATPDYTGIVVLDPDGWDRSNFEESWAEAITRDEFESRIGTSTCQWPRDYFTRASGS